MLTPLIAAELQRDPLQNFAALARRLGCTRAMVSYVFHRVADDTTRAAKARQRLPRRRELRCARCAGLRERNKSYCEPCRDVMARACAAEIQRKLYAADPQRYYERVKASRARRGTRTEENRLTAAAG